MINLNKSCMSCILIYWEQNPKPQCFSFTFNGEEMSQVDHTKHLGIHIEILTFSKQAFNES